MSQFTPIGKNKSQKDVLALSLGKKDLGKLLLISKSLGISRQALVIQMINHCMTEMEETSKKQLVTKVNKEATEFFMKQLETNQ